jgi:MoxR-like ATPase
VANGESTGRDWYVYQGTGQPHDLIAGIPKPPSWRLFNSDAAPVAPWVELREKERLLGENYKPAKETVELVNAAIYLRRPLLVQGRPGIGKSTLATAIAYELNLGRVLRWTITSRATRTEGLYSYDPLARLHDASRRPNDEDPERPPEEIGSYIRLGPLGTALLPSVKPRVLLIDEIDKSDIDLPNDLLAIFEDGYYVIPELARQAADTVSHVLTEDSNERVPIRNGEVHCRDFPLVVMTSNGEREFPAAFLRRCIPVTITPPDADKLKDIVAAHLKGLADSSDDIIRQFMSAQAPGDLATDQLLNAIYLTDVAGQRSAGVDRHGLAKLVMNQLRLRADDR